MEEKRVQNKERERGNVWGLLPIGVFLVLFLGMGIISGDFYGMPAVVAFLIALIVAFLQNRSLSFEEKLKIVAAGVGDENIVTMCLIFLAAGAFSGTVTAAGGADSTVALGLSILPPGIAVAGTYADWLLHVGFHGNQYGNHRGAGAHCHRDQRKDRIFYGNLYRRGGKRRYVR